MAPVVVEEPKQEEVKTPVEEPKPQRAEEPKKEVFAKPEAKELPETKEEKDANKEKEAQDNEDSLNLTIGEEDEKLFNDDVSFILSIGRARSLHENFRWVTTPLRKTVKMNRWRQTRPRKIRRTHKKKRIRDKKLALRMMRSHLKLRRMEKLGNFH